MSNEENKDQELDNIPATEETTPAIEETVAAAPVAEVKAPVVNTVIDDSAEEEEPIELILDSDSLTVGSGHDEFDWARGKRGQVLYSAEESKSYLELSLQRSKLGG